MRKILIVCISLFHSVGNMCSGIDHVKTGGNIPLNENVTRSKSILHWKCETIAKFPNLDLSSSFIFNNDTSLIVSNSGKVIVSGGNLANWQTVGEGLPPGFVLDQAFFVDQRNGWIIGSLDGKGKNNDSDFIRNYVFRTNDGGESWSIIKHFDETEILDLEFLDKRIGFIVGVDHRNRVGVLLGTKDGGATWTSFPFLDNWSSIESVNIVSSSELRITGMTTEFVLASVAVESKQVTQISSVAKSKSEGVRKSGLNSGNFWFFSSADAREGLTSTIGIYSGSDWSMVSVAGWLNSVEFLDYRSVMVTGVNRLNGVEAPFLRFSDDQGKSFRNLCQEDSIPEILSLRKFGSDQVLAVGRNAVIRVQMPNTHSY